MGSHVHANGIAIHYEQAGAGQDLVLISGLGASTHVWYPQLRGLSGVLRVTALDPRGHGQTDKPVGPYSVELLADDAAAALDALGISQAVLVGSSMASLIVVELAARRPDLVAGLIVVGGFAKLGPEGRAAFEQRAVLAETEGMAPLADLVPVRAFGAHSHATQPGLVGLFRQGLLTNDPVAYAASCRAIRDADVTEALEKVQCPTLIVLGEQEQVAPLAAARMLKAGIPQAQVRILPSAGHLPFIEQPALFNAAVQEFVGNL